MIQKYNIASGRVLSIGSQSTFNKVGFQNGSLYIWLDNKGEQQESVGIKVCMTGQDSPKGFIFIDTVFNEDVSYVAHVYRSVMSQDIMKSIF